VEPHLGQQDSKVRVGTRVTRLKQALTLVKKQDGVVDLRFSEEKPQQFLLHKQTKWSS